ncbi:MAG: sucrase ferredoxin [Phycicoccus sp.]|nr:sucrase ferredoxin [Phycicoccus sp.]NMM35773.1 sucrase ferredoxin [Phycicoccus sp.]
MTGASAGTHARSQPDACSVIWDTAQGSALGTAAAARFWIALEQSGPWGRAAATQSRLDPELGLALDRRAQEERGRLILIRRPGAHSTAHEGPHRVYLAGGLAHRPWLLQADLHDPAQLLRLPWAALREGDIDTVRSWLPAFDESARPILMICSNSKRDICCAVRGRPVALESSSQRPGQVWESSHTGGHHFAPTGVLLPHGQAFARLSSATAVAVVDAAARGELPLELLGTAYDRGRSHLTPPEQAAESVVRQQIQEPTLRALTTKGVPHATRANAWCCRVSHIDGRRWDVVAVRSSGGEDRPESCGGMAVPTWQWSVLSDVGP